MRLDDKIRDFIKNELASQLGGQAYVRLFGSCADDAQRGGDTYLLIQPHQVIVSRIQVECRLAERLFIELGGRKVDVLIEAPLKPTKAIYESALRHGIIL